MSGKGKVCDWVFWGEGGVKQRICLCYGFQLVSNEMRELHHSIPPGRGEYRDCDSPVALSSVAQAGMAPNTPHRCQPFPFFSFRKGVRVIPSIPCFPHRGIWDAGLAFPVDWLFVAMVVHWFQSQSPRIHLGRRMFGCNIPFAPR